MIGGSGLAGEAVRAVALQKGLAVTSPTRGHLDLARPESAAREVETIAPGAVVNAASFTDVVRAESPDHREELLAVNRDGPEAVAGACRALGIPLVHLSTDYVFDGGKLAPYEEGDDTRPLQAFGHSKLLGETAVLGAYPDATVVRTSLLFGSGRQRRPAFVDSVLQQARQMPTIRIADPPVGSPTLSTDLAEAILSLLESRPRGVVHVANSGCCGRVDLARAAVEAVGLGGIVTVESERPPDGFPRRPGYSALSCRRLEDLTGRRLRPWRVALEAHLREARP